MNQMLTEAKQVINRAVAECWSTWPLSPRDMQEVLISIAGDIAVSEGHLTPDQADTCPACFGDCERLHNDGLMHKCEVCGGTGKRRLS